MLQQPNFENATPKEMFKATQILHFSLILGATVMFLLLWFTMGTPMNMNPMDGTFSLIMPFAMVAIVILALNLYTKNRNAIPKDATLTEKLIAFRQISLMRWALIEGVTLLSLMLFFFHEANISILFAFSLGLFAMAIFRPTVDGFADEFDLNQQERNQLK